MIQIRNVFLIFYSLTFAIGCNGQIGQSEISKNKVIDQPPSPITGNLKEQDRVAKEIYRLQRELRDLKINDFINDVKQFCQVTDSEGVDNMSFILEEKSGNLKMYYVNGEERELACIDDRLIRIQNNFGEMSFGFVNSFRMKPTTVFEIKMNAEKE